MSEIENKLSGMESNVVELFDRIIERVKQRKQILLNQIKQFRETGLDVVTICTEYSIVVKRVLSNPTQYNALLEIAPDIESKCIHKSKKYANMDKLLHFEPPHENKFNNLIDNLGYITDNFQFGLQFSIVDTGYGYINVSWNTNGKKLTDNEKIEIEYIYNNDVTTKTINKSNNYDDCSLLHNVIGKYGIYSIKIRNCTLNAFGNWFCTQYTETQTINIQKPKKGLNIDASWDTNDKWKSNHIIIKSNNIIKSNDGHIGSIFLSNILKKGKYIYTFKIIKEDSDNIGFCVYNTQFGSPLLDDKLSKTKPKSSYCFDSYGYLESHHNPGSLDSNSPPMDPKSNSVIKMIIDLIEYRLSFIIDSNHYRLSFDIKKSEYKVGIYLSKLDKVQFISCKQIQ